MATGIECAGLLLAILPLFIEAGKSYAKGVDSLRNVAVADRKDEALEEFYYDFHEQVVEINEHVNSIYNFMSKTAQGENFPPPAKLLSKWREDPSVQKALKAYFGSDDRFNRFVCISSKICELLKSLIKDKAINLFANDLNEAVMFQKLEYYTLLRTSNSLKTSFLERIRFFMGKRDRDKFLRNLQDCTKKLDKLIKRVEKEARGVHLDHSRISTVRNARAQSATTLSLKVRSLIAKLYNTLGDCWNCTCNAEHKIRLRLSERGYPRDETDVALEFIAFVKLPDSSCWWQEAKILVTPSSDTHFNSRKHPEKLCDLSQPSIAQDSLMFIVEDINGQPTMWQLPSEPRTARFSESDNPSSLYELLDGPGKMSRREKLRLAITLSYSLLFLHDSAWVSRGWKKEDLFFFYKREDEPDYESPYLSARLTNSRKLLNNDKGSDGPVASSEGILTLGILLLEIFEEKPIERWRTLKDKKHLNAFTDRYVAERVVEKMDSSPSQAAVRACLDWMKKFRSEISLEKQEVRLELFERVIAPLEEELELLNR